MSTHILAPRVVQFLLAIAGLCVPVFRAHARQTSRDDSVRLTRTDSVRADSTQRLAEIRVRGKADDLIGIARSASQGRVGRDDLLLRPLQREGEILEAVPGMILTQHSGDGKANQMVVRGFNLDHGTDFQTRLESMPMNLPTHGHGHGYTDLNPLIPEFIDHLEYKLGPMYAEIGDFGSSGGAALQLVRSLPTPVARVEVGDFGFRRTVLGGGRTSGASHWMLGGEAKRYDGPWEQPQALGKYSGMARWTWRGRSNELSLLALGYANRWNATDQVPGRVLAAGTVGRFGSLDSTLGGDARRQSLSLAWTRTLARGRFSLDAFAVHHAFNLYSNFTYFLDNAADGDQINQTDRRTVAGLNAELSRVTLVGDVSHVVRAGLQLRGDGIAVGLFRSAQGARGDTVRTDDIRQGSAGAYASLESQWRPRWRSVVGLREDIYSFRVTSNDVRNSGERTAAIASPKLSLIYQPASGTELYLGGGLGFHSNDARGTTIRVDPVTGEDAESVDPLVRSRGTELGVRASRGESLRATAALWTLDLDSELLFVGDAGTTEALGRSRRVGVTMASFWQPNRAITLDGDLSLTRARFVDAASGGDRIPGALGRVVTAGATWAARPSVQAVVRLRHFGASALVEDNSVRGAPTTLVNASLGWTVRGTLLSISALNVFNTRANDVQYFYASRLAGEAGEGVPDLHVHPVEPRMLRIGLARGF